jgi:hypothetical protein
MKFTAIYHEKKWTAFWFIVAALVTLRMVMVSDLNLAVVYGPHDGSLYLTRAFHLLNSGNFGHYDSATLLKSPGISLWIAGMRLLGIPYMLSINLIHMLAALYLVFALRRTVAGPMALLATFALLLFNSVVFGNEWFFIGREPLDLSISILLVAGMMLFIANVRSCGALWNHGLVVALSFTFLLLLREENVLLWSFLFGVVGLGLWQARLNGMRIGWKHPLLVIGLVAAMTAGAGQLGARYMIGRMYGVPLMNDFSSGEFPKFIAALRSASGRQTNSYVSITQKALAEVMQAVPRVAPHFAPLISPLDFDEYYFKRWGVRAERPDSFFFIIIKDAAYHAGLTPTLPAGQAYFRQARIEIEQACRTGRLKCSPAGDGLFAPLRSEWIPRMGKEMLNIATMMATLPGNVARGPYLPVVNVLGSSAADIDAFYPVVQDDVLVGEPAINLGRQYQVTALTSFDSLQQWQINPNESQRVVKEQFYAQLKERSPLYISPLREWRRAIVNINWLGSTLVILGLAAIIVHVATTKVRDYDVVLVAALAFVGMSVLKIVALGFISVHMGALDHRLFYSTHIILLALAPALLAKLLHKYRVRRTIPSE